VSTNLRKLLDVNTGHVTPADAGILEERAGSLNVHPMREEYGFFVWVPTADLLDEYIETFREESGVSDAFLGLLRYAREHDCDWLLLDRDAPFLADLPTFDSEGP
jgi:hypothetical protein